MRRRVLLLGERGNPMAQSGNFPTGGILMHDASLRGPHDDGLGLAESGDRQRPVPGRNGILDLTHIAAQP